MSGDSDLGTKRPWASLEEFSAISDRAKKEARRSHQNRRSESYQEDSPRSPNIPEMPNLTISSAIPGLGQARNATSPVQSPTGAESNQKVKQEAEDPLSTSSLPPTNKYASLTSAKKRSTTQSGTTYDSLISDRRADTTAERESTRAATTGRKVSQSGQERPERRPFAPPKKPPKSEARPEYAFVERIDTRDGISPPDWYAEEGSQNIARVDLVNMNRIRDLIKNAQKAKRKGGDVVAAIKGVRRRLYEMEFFGFISRALVKKSRVLDSVGLPQIFDDPEDVGFPWDVKADARTLFQRWHQGETDPHLFRGIIVEKKGLNSKERISYSLDPNYLWKKSPNVVGANGLQVGQWWPIQLCTLRDGAHGSAEGGIHGPSLQGAYSIVMSAGGYADVDEGDKVLYCGTSGSADGQPSAGTNQLKLSMAAKIPVRLIRSHKLKSIYSPSHGLRYDGLYEIVNFEIIHPETAMHRFMLKRIPGQDPIRYAGPQNNIEARPTGAEVAAWDKIKQLYGPSVKW